METKNQNYSRRDFISKAPLAFASVGLLKVSETGSRLPIPVKDRRVQQGDIVYRTLGRTGLKIPVVSMGVMNADNPEIVKNAYEAGIRLFDTAEGYQGGRNERMVGTVINQLNARKDVIIQTKIPHPDRRARGGRTTSSDRVRSAFLSSFEGCRERLQTDYVDILMIHDVSTARIMNDPGVHEAMDTLKKENKIRFTGFSTHSNQAAMLNEAARTGYYDVVLASFNFTMSDDQRLLEAVKNAASENIGVIAMKTQASSGRSRGGNVNQTAALKWALNQEGIVTAIPGFTNFDHMKEDFSVAYGLDYTPEERRFLGNSDTRQAFSFCRQCANCIGTCPEEVDIPALMRTHMYAAGYGNFYQARDTIDGIHNSRSLKICSKCPVCVAQCSHSVDIVSNIDELKLMYA
ncbi:aldo/keto reductase [candidate division KSB1 bacterium]